MPLTQIEIAHVKALGWEPEATTPLTISDVWLSNDVQLNIGTQLNFVCARLNLPYEELRKKLSNKLYWHKLSGQLGIMIDVQGTDVESLYLQIPSDHWGFREAQQTH